MESKDLVSIYSVANAAHAEIIKNALQAEGIRAFVEEENLVPGLTGVQFRIDVSAADADRARKIVASHDAGKQAKPHHWTDKKK